MITITIIQMVIFGLILLFTWDTFPVNEGILILTAHSFIILFIIAISAIVLVRVSTSRGGIDDVFRLVTGTLVGGFVFAVLVSLLNGTWLPLGLPFADLLNLQILPVDAVVAILLSTIANILTYFMLRSHRPRSA